MQAATALETLKMDASPAKKLNFKPADTAHEKAVPLVGLPELANVSEVDAPKEDVDDEPLLRENPNRFVLFPIKYHEVYFPYTTRS